MNIRKLILLVLMLPLLVFGQSKQFEIIGSITGEHKDRIYVFFDNDISQKDSIYANIVNGRFYFKLNAALPILCKFHFGKKTNIQELYIDNTKTYISLNSTLTEKNTPNSKDGPRTLFEVKKVSGSKTQDIIHSFKTWQFQLEKGSEPKGRKNSEYFEELRTIILKYPKSKASAYLIVGGGYLLGKAFMFQGEFHLQAAQVNELKSMLDSELQNTYEFQNILILQNSISKRVNREIGSSFHDVILKDTANNNIDTRVFRGKYVLLDFWASWCTPCKASIPELKVLYEKYKEKGFEIIGVSLDENKSDWTKAVYLERLPWLQLRDDSAFNGLLPRYYDITGVPLKLLLDRDGKVVGFYSSGGEIENVLNHLL